MPVPASRCAWSGSSPRSLVVRSRVCAASSTPSHTRARLPLRAIVARAAPDRWALPERGVGDRVERVVQRAKLAAHLDQAFIGSNASSIRSSWAAIRSSRSSRCVELTIRTSTRSTFRSTPARFRRSRIASTEHSDRGPERIDPDVEWAPTRPSTKVWCTSSERRTGLQDRRAPTGGGRGQIGAPRIAYSARCASFADRVPGAELGRQARHRRETRRSRLPRRRPVPRRRAASDESETVGLDTADGTARRHTYGAREEPGASPERSRRCEGRCSPPRRHWPRAGKAVGEERPESEDPPPPQTPRRPRGREKEMHPCHVVSP